jgi:hypothetical protein
MSGLLVPRAPSSPKPLSRRPFYMLRGLVTAFSKTLRLREDVDRETPKPPDRHLHSSCLSFQGIQVMSTHPRPRRWSFATVVCCFLILNLPVGDGDAQASLEDSHPASAAEALPANTSANNPEPIALLTDPETDTAASQRLQSHRLSGQVASESSDARRFRAVGINPRVLAPEIVKPGDTLYLALLDDVHLWATVDHISSDINGVRSLRGRVQESEHGTVLLSIGEESMLAHVVIPELEQEFVIPDFGEELGHIARRWAQTRGSTSSGATTAPTNPGFASNARSVRVDGCGSAGRAPRLLVMPMPA